MWLKRYVIKVRITKYVEQKKIYIKLELVINIV